MSTKPRTSEPTSERGFKALLALGALVSIGIGIAGVLSPALLESVLGLQVPRRAYGVTRMFGGLSLASGVGFALAAAHPARSRGLLVQCFAVPGILAITTIISVARDEMNTGKGIVFAVYNVAFCLLYFRMYPRIQAKPPDQSASTSKNLAP